MVVSLKISDGYRFCKCHEMMDAMIFKSTKANLIKLLLVKVYTITSYYGHEKIT